jgi:urease subunit gamma
MKLTPKEEDRLTIFGVAQLAQRRRERGILLNQPECVALICDAVFEDARAGLPYAEVLERAGALIRRDEVMEGVPEMLGLVQVEAMFPDGNKLVTVRNPIR